MLSNPGGVDWESILDESDGLSSMESELSLCDWEWVEWILCRCERKDMVTHPLWCPERRYPELRSRMEVAVALAGGANALPPETYLGIASSL